MKKDRIMYQVYSDLMLNKPGDENRVQDYGRDIEDVISERCGSIVLYSLYETLAPYYEDCVKNNLTIDNYLPHIQVYLYKLLSYIRIIENLLGVSYTPSNRDFDKEVLGDWKEPTDADLRKIELDNK